jgi:hypothetical protein
MFRKRYHLFCNLEECQLNRTLRYFTNSKRRFDLVHDKAILKFQFDKMHPHYEAFCLNRPDSFKYSSITVQVVDEGVFNYILCYENNDVTKLVNHPCLN